MKFFRKNVLNLFVLLCIVFVYRNWFTKGLLSAPDFPFVHPTALGDYTWWPYAWSHSLGNGIGGTTLTLLNLNTYVSLGIRLLVFTFHLSWNAVYRLLFFWPFVFLGTAAVWMLTRSAIAVLVYMTNTYVLMLAGGGQVGLMMAYATVPWVLSGFVYKKRWLITLAGALLVLFDLRFSFLTAIIVAFYVALVVPQKKWIEMAILAITSALVILGIHSFWIIPSLFSSGLALPAGYDNPGWLSYLSWAEFSKTLSLLHPNWPENIFGKTYFLRPEFLILPIVAFGTLLGARRNRLLWFGLFLILTGAFLAKGAKPPFGAVNEWIFLYVPLFNGFRDPTKFYLLTVFGYAVVLPMTLDVLTRLFRKPIIAFFFVLFWVYTIFPVVRGQGTGTFSRVSVPEVYSGFEQLVIADSSFGRTLAVPWKSRFVYQSERHSLVEARDLFRVTDISAITASMSAQGTGELLRALAIKYVIVPEDSLNEVFLTDRTYDPKKRQAVVNMLDTLPFLEKKKGFETLDVYEVTRSRGNFYTVFFNSDVNTLTSRQIDPVTYEVAIHPLTRPLSVYFSESYDPKWKLWDGNKILSPKRTVFNTMEYKLDSESTSFATVYYEGQRWLTVGIYVSLVVMLCGIFYVFRKRGTVLIVFVVVATILELRLIPKNDGNILHNPSIWWSNEWNMLSDPYRKRDMSVSHFGGSEIRFRIKGTKMLAFRLISANSDAKSIGIDVIADDKTFTLHSPFQGEISTIPQGFLDSGRETEVTIRHWCAGTLSPCELGLLGMYTDKGATLRKTAQPPPPVLGVIGDSISVSFGRDNYLYTFANRVGYRLHNASIFGSLVGEAAGWDSAAKRYEKDIARYRPEFILVILGTNDLGQGQPLSVFRENYRTFIRQMKEESPNSRLILFGLFRRLDISSTVTSAYSRVIRETAQKYGLLYIDPYDWLTPEDFQDLVHPSKRSQGKIADRLFGATHSIIK